MNPMGRLPTAFFELVCALEKNHDLSPWAKAQGVRGWIDSLIGEVLELGSVLAKENGHPDTCPSCMALRHSQPMRFSHYKHHVECKRNVPTMEELAAIADEMGDVFWNLIALSFALHDAGGPFLAQILESANVKLHRRKPWIFTEGAILPTTADEEHRLYTAHKASLAEHDHDD